MPSRLQQILAAVQGRMPAIPRLTYHYKRVSLQTPSAPPRIVWIPTDDDFGQALASITNPPALMTRWAGVEAHLWGGDEPAAEELLHRVLVALRKTCGGAHALKFDRDRGRWLTEDEKKAAKVNQGDVYVLSFQLGIPVCDEPYQVALVGDVVPATPPVAGDGVLSCGES